MRCSQFVDFADMLAAFKQEDLERAIAYTAQLAALSPAPLCPRSRAIPCDTYPMRQRYKPGGREGWAGPLSACAAAGVHVAGAGIASASQASTRANDAKRAHLTALPHRVSPLRSCLSLRLAFRNLAHAHSACATVMQCAFIRSVCRRCTVLDAEEAEEETEQGGEY